MGVFLVVTHGFGALDLYSLRLLRYMNIKAFHADIYQKISEQLGKSLLNPITVSRTLDAFAFFKKLLSTPGTPHLPNHHLGRFGFFLKKPFILTVHDVMRYLDVKCSTPLIAKPNFKDVFCVNLDYKGALKAERIIVPSYYTKRELTKHFQVKEENIRIIHHGIDEDFRPTYGKKLYREPYILYVGSEQPRKNLQTLLKAFYKLKKDPKFKHLKLVKVGRTGGSEADFRGITLKTIQALNLEKDVILEGWLSSQKDLASLYTQAEIFVFPSIYEGFGWPPLEAMACGCPVISSSTTSMPEILGDAPIYVNPYDVEELRQRLAEVLTDDRLRKELSIRGFKRVKQFSWKKAASQTLKVYEEVEEQIKS